MGENDVGNDVVVFVILLFMVGLGFLFGLVVFNDDNLSEETMSDICYNFTGVQGVEGYGLNGKLVCKTPSFDSTQNIIIRGNEE